MGRWTQRDRIAERGGLNLQAFTLNDPQNAVDRRGLDVWAIDGTGSTWDNQSNVRKFVERYRDGQSHWWNGVGTGLGDELFGSRSGDIAVGVARDICRVYKESPGIVIDVVGFSRGAAIANEVAWILSEGCPCGEGKNWKSRGGEKPKVRFLGLFDTVHSMGSVFGWFTGAFRPGNFAWHTDSIAPNVRSAAHANAMDEHRREFRYSPVEPTSPSTQYRQKWFRGVHSDVGGYSDPVGTPGRKVFNQTLSAISLRWMVEQAASSGVSMNTSGLISDSDIEEAARLGELETTRETQPIPFQDYFWEPDRGPRKDVNAF